MDCLWCNNPNADDTAVATSASYKQLCRYHLAEYEGLSLDGLDRMEAAEHADMADLGYFDY
jgi:hypothetical protein